MTNKQRLQRIFDDPRVRKIGSFTFFCGANKLFWGIWLLIPFWNTFSTGKSYEAMSHLMDENTWGIILLVAGIYHLVAYYKEHHLHLMIARSVSLAIWLFISFMVITSNIASTGVPNYVLLAVVDFIIVTTRGGNQP